MPLPESPERAYLPDDHIDATELNALQFGITANHARIEALAAPALQWLVGKTLGAVTFAADGVATINGTATVFLDVRQAPIAEVRVHCRANGATSGTGMTLAVHDGATELAEVTHTGDGSTWVWVALELAGFMPEQATRLSLRITASQQSADCVTVLYQAL